MTSPPFCLGHNIDLGSGECLNLTSLWADSLGVICEVGLGTR